MKIKLQFLDFRIVEHPPAQILPSFFFPFHEGCKPSIYTTLLHIDCMNYQQLLEQVVHGPFFVNVPNSMSAVTFGRSERGRGFLKIGLDRPTYPIRKGLLLADG